MKRLRSLAAQNASFVVAMALGGMPVARIAQFFDVGWRTVMAVLRENGLGGRAELQRIQLIVQRLREGRSAAQIENELIYKDQSTPEKDITSLMSEQWVWAERVIATMEERRRRRSG